MCLKEHGELRYIQKNEAKEGKHGQRVDANKELKQKN
jgi:hypothetical protein